MGGAVSAGATNYELIENLVKADYIKTPTVIQIFRCVDRASYYLPEHRENAYKDLAWKHGKLHMSAPCIYAEVMESLDLQPGLSFLNLGSGTGYLSTLAGLALGAYGQNHGVEIHEDVIQYAKERQEEFTKNNQYFDEFEYCEPIFLNANCLHINSGCQLYDRVYCGAGCPHEHENYMKNLLKVGGVLVMPLNDQLVKITRKSEVEWESKMVLPVSFASLVPADNTAFDMVDLPEPHVMSLQEVCRVVIRRIIRQKQRMLDPKSFNHIPKHKKKGIKKLETADCEEFSSPVSFIRRHRVNIIPAMMLMAQISDMEIERSDTDEDSSSTDDDDEPTLRKQKDYNPDSDREDDEVAEADHPDAMTSEKEQKQKKKTKKIEKHRVNLMKSKKKVPLPARSKKTKKIEDEEVDVEEVSEEECDSDFDDEPRRTVPRLHTRRVLRDHERRKQAARTLTESPVDSNVDDEGIEEDVMPPMMSIKPHNSMNGVSGLSDIPENDEPFDYKENGLDHDRAISTQNRNQAHSNQTTSPGVSSEEVEEVMELDQPSSEAIPITADSKRPRYCSNNSISTSYTSGVGTCSSVEDQPDLDLNAELDSISRGQESLPSAAVSHLIDNSSHIVNTNTQSITAKAQKHDLGSIEKSNENSTNSKARCLTSSKIDEDLSDRDYENDFDGVKAFAPKKTKNGAFREKKDTGARAHYKNNESSAKELEERENLIDENNDVNGYSNSGKSKESNEKFSPHSSQIVDSALASTSQFDEPPAVNNNNGIDFDDMTFEQRYATVKKVMENMHDSAEKVEKKEDDSSSDDQSDCSRKIFRDLLMESVKQLPVPQALQNYLLYYRN